MTFVELQAYRGYGTPVQIVCERILLMHQIDYNGNYGVEITLDTGSTVRVEGFLSDVRKKIDAAMSASKEGA